MKARVIPHRARVVRCWHIAQVSPGRWQGRVVSRVDHVGVVTEVGSLYLVEEAVRNGGHCRGLPIRITRELPVEATA